MRFDIGVYRMHRANGPKSSRASIGCPFDSFRSAVRQPQFRASIKEAAEYASPPGDYSAAAAFLCSGFSSRKRGMTYFAKSVMFATVSLWSKKPPWPNINKCPKPPTLSLSALI